MNAGQAELIERLIKSLKRHGLVFAQWNPALGSALASDEGHARLRRIGTVAELEACRDAIEVPVCWWEFEELIRTTDPLRALGVAREKIHNFLDQGGKVCLVSRSSRLAYPAPLAVP